MAEPTPRAIAEAYRSTQARIAGEAGASAAVALRTLLTASNLDAGLDLLVAAVLTIVQAARRRLSGAAGAYYLSQRAARGITAPDPPVATAPDLPAAQVTTVTLVTGPVEVKRQIAQGVPIVSALDTAAATLGKASYRLVADAGRSTIRGTVRRDPVALGWARVTDGDPCAFCAMLASRGPVYLSRESAGDPADPYHDGCGCYPEPVYSRDQAWPGRAREFEALWIEATKGKSGRAAVNAFRRAYDAKSQQD